MHVTVWQLYLFREMHAAVVLTRSLLRGSLISNRERRSLYVNIADEFLWMMK